MYGASITRLGLGLSQAKGKSEKTTLSLLLLASPVNDDCPCSTFPTQAGKELWLRRKIVLSHSLLPFLSALSIQVMSTLRERGAYSICIKSLSPLLSRRLTREQGLANVPWERPFEEVGPLAAASERISKQLFRGDRQRAPFGGHFSPLHPVGPSS